MQRFLAGLKFSIDDNLSDLMGLMQAAQLYRLENKKASTDKITRTTALAVLVERSPEIDIGLTSLGFNFREYLNIIGLEFPIKWTQKEEIDIHLVFRQALRNYAKSDDAIRETSYGILAIAILEDVVARAHHISSEIQLEERLRASGLDLDRLRKVLQSRSLSFDARSGLKNVGDRHSLAEKLSEAGHHEEALAVYEEGIKRFPDDAKMWVGKAETLRNVERKNEALSVYQEGLEKFSDDITLRMGMAELLREMDRIPAALDIYKESIQIFPNYVIVRTEMAETLREESRHEEALALYNDAIREFPDDNRVRVGMVATLREMNRHPEAKDLEESLGIVEPSSDKVEESEKRSTAPFYSDQPARQDLLNRKAVAETIGTMIDSIWATSEDDRDSQDRAFMIHLHGRWGAGKTSILNFCATRCFREMLRRGRVKYQVRLGWSSSIMPG